MDTSTTCDRTRETDLRAVAEELYEESGALVMTLIATKVKRTSRAL